MNKGKALFAVVFTVAILVAMLGTLGAQSLSFTQKAFAMAGLLTVWGAVVGAAYGADWSM